MQQSNEKQPLDKITFTEHLTHAYAHLYDLVHLRSQPLLSILAPEPALSRKEKAWKMHHILLDIISELKPESQADAFARQRRRHNLMMLRYVKGLDPSAVAEQLLISRRHYYREHNIAIEIIADILWHRYALDASTEPSSQSDTEEALAELSGMELFRLETARLATANRHARIKSVVASVLPLLQNILEKYGNTLDMVIPDPFPSAAVAPHFLKQILLSVLSFLIENVHQTRIEGESIIEGDAIHLRLNTVPDTAIRVEPGTGVQERLTILAELGEVSGAHIQPIYAGSAVKGFDIELPIARRTVLVIDDNRDILELFSRYLSANHYHAVTTQEAEGALLLARKIHPYAITVDLMMPGQDGWDLLQILLNHPEIENVPIIVCSVLKQKELALSLGATAFLEKPITEQSLLSVLGALEED